MHVITSTTYPVKYTMDTVHGSNIKSSTYIWALENKGMYVASPSNVSAYSVNVYLVQLHFKCYFENPNKY